MTRPARRLGSRFIGSRLSRLPSRASVPAAAGRSADDTHQMTGCSGYPLAGRPATPRPPAPIGRSAHEGRARHTWTCRAEDRTRRRCAWAETTHRVSSLLGATSDEIHSASGEHRRREDARTAVRVLTAHAGGRGAWHGAGSSAGRRRRNRWASRWLLGLPLQRGPDSVQPRRRHHQFDRRRPGRPTDTGLLRQTRRSPGPCLQQSGRSARRS